MRRKSVLTIVCLLVLATVCMAAGETATRADSTAVTEPVATADTLPDGAAESDTAAVRRKFGRRFADYFVNANKPHPDKKFDFSIIGGPQYSSTTSFGVGLVAAGVYRMNRLDTITQPSVMSFYGNVSVTGFYLLGVRGTNIFPGDRYRLLYNFYFFSFPSNFWGWGYDNGANRDNKSSYLRLQNQVKLDFLFRLAHNLYVGPMASFDYVAGRSFSNPGLLQGQPRKTFTTGVGASVSYDTRDLITNAYRGVYVKLEQGVYPSFLGNRQAFAMTDIIVDWYKRAWKSGVIAIDFHSKFNYGDVPWTMMSRMGGVNRMRGYYEGQYRDNNITELQVELRQHLWRRNGMAIWAGAANVYRDFKSFDIRHTLPNYGVGYRWEFKERVNVRLDLGFGKEGVGFMFNINEAF
ncbi:MAG: BamA/TamA family outer membrane protein [Coprobacter sp.]|nr:BamA/TamA family outer membrane protein [Coprobacter sp.]